MTKKACSTETLLPQSQSSSSPSTAPNEEKTKNQAAAQPLPPKGWDRCHAYLPQKRRFCRQMISPSSAHITNNGGRPITGTEPLYCGNHLHLLSLDNITAETTNDDTVSSPSPSHRNGKRPRPSSSIEDGLKRIPCPIDPSHTIYAHMLKKHVRICPKATQRRRETSREYYRRDVNTGGEGPLATTAEEVAVHQSHLALSVLEVFTALFPPSSPRQPSDASYDDIYHALPTHDHSPSELSSGLTTAIETNRIRSGGVRHATQQGSIVGHLRRVDLLPSSSSREDRPTTTVVEMGAGRGMLGLIVAGIRHVSSETRLVMVERGGSRHKADGRVRCATAARNESGGGGTGTEGLYLRLDGLDVRRIKCDLAHVHLPSVLKGGDEREGSIAIAKHLCGVGTDLALKSLASLPTPPVKGCAFATCCHGVCRWDDYVGRRFLVEAFDKYSRTKRTPFGKEDFDIMRRWTSGSVRRVGEDATEGKKEGDDEEDHGMAVVEREESSVPRATNKTDYYNNVTTIVKELNLSCGVRGLGRACQRLIDYGRQEYMRHHLGFENVTMCHYVEEDVTPQNALLMAWNGKQGMNE